MAKIDCSVTVNFLSEWKRYCSFHPCSECLLNQNKVCQVKDHPDRAVKIVQEWSDKHPVKTRLDDIKERYPNVPLNGLGTPRFDPWMLGYCDKCSDCPHCIGDDYCWHEPLVGGATGKAVE